MNFVHNRVDMENMDDEQLVLFARDGYEDAFALLVRRCTVMIQQQAMRYRNGWLDAEDLAQEGLMGLLSAVRTFREEGGASFRTYAYVCIRHRMLAAARRMGAARDIPSSEWESLGSDEELALSANNGQADPAQLVVQWEDTERLRGRLQKMLTVLEYDVLMLYLGAYTYEEIAHWLELSTKAVDNALQRVRRKLAAGSWLDG